MAAVAMVVVVGSRRVPVSMWPGEVVRLIQEGRREQEAPMVELSNFPVPIVLDHGTPNI